MFHCVIRGPISRFPHQVIKLPTVFPLLYFCFIKGFQFPHCVIKVQRALNFPLRHQGPQISSSCRQNDDLISHHVIKGSQFIIASSIKGPIVTSNFSSHYQGVPFIIASSRGPISPIASSKRPKFQKKKQTNKQKTS